MISELAESTQKLIKELYDIDISVTFARPDAQFGDFATNVALQLAGQLGMPPREIADSIANKMNDATGVKKVSVAGAGFINITISDSLLFASINSEPVQNQGSLLLEYSCPNAFKDLHVGHLYQTILGDALGRVYARLGWDVYRVTYGGDVGRHVAMSMWAILKEFGSETPEKLENVAQDQRSQWLATKYVEGTKAFETNEETKAEILSLNKKIYALHQAGDHDSNFAKIYWIARSWSYDSFSKFYDDIEVMPFDRSIGESETFDPGLAIVTANTGPVFEESDGAVILSKERSGLHTRVFVNTEGLPTYEAKDLGVITLEASEVSYDKRIIMTGNEQREYMRVVFAALKLIDPDLGAKQNSLTHGLVKFADGQKMSSRLGNVTRASDVVDVATSAVDADSPELKKDIALGAIKYTFLKNSIGADIAFDLEKSVSLEGNSGPYLQYALVRARAILRASGDVSSTEAPITLDEHERNLASWLSRYPEALEACVTNNSLHDLCSYLYESSQVFNRFYENCRVVDDPRSNIRLPIVRAYEKVLADGLTTLGIPTPEQM